MSTALATESDPLRLVAVVRISKDRDNETSTQTQPFDIARWADAHGMTIVQTFTEVARSGFKIVPRPKLDEALAMVRNGLADGIIVWKVDRFTRKGAKEIFRMLTLVGEGGFLIATEDGIDTRGDSMADIIKLTVIAELARGESLAKSDRAKAWHRGRLRGEGTQSVGVPLPPAGRRPFGYNRNATVLMINEAEAEHVRTMCADFIAGESLRSIVATMNASGIRAEGNPWTHRGVRYVITSETIAGGRYVDGSFVRGAWEPIVPIETVEACAAILADPTRRTSYNNQPAYLLTGGIATCGKEGCEGTFRYKLHPRGARYLCKACGQSIPIAVADAVVTETVLAMLAGDAWQTLRASGRTHDADAIAFLTARADHVRARWLDGKLTDAEYDHATDEIKDRLDAIRSAPVVELPDVPNVAAAWHHPTKPLDVNGKRQVIAAATQSVRIMPHGELQGTMRVVVI